VNFDWSKILLGEEDWSFLLTIAFRTTVMFIVIMSSLRILGKRGVKQLSVFELGVIIGLGSAAGDPMFYDDVGILGSILVIITVVLLYRVLTYLMDKNENIERVMEGKPVDIVRGGKMVLASVEKESLSRPEMFMQLRLFQVSHLGQVKLAILEPTGEVSVFFFREEEVIHGLPILPDKIEFPEQHVRSEGHYSCITCSYTAYVHAADLHKVLTCPDCHDSKWVLASNETRVE
jgi:uncharacterized membrane protein YcaP (DUF421 family)